VQAGGFRFAFYAACNEAANGYGRLALHKSIISSMLSMSNQILLFFGNFACYCANLLKRYNFLSCILYINHFILGFALSNVRNVPFIKKASACACFTILNSARANLLILKKGLLEKYVAANQ